MDDLTPDSVADALAFNAEPAWTGGGRLADHLRNVIGEDWSMPATEANPFQRLVRLLFQDNDATGHPQTPAELRRRTLFVALVECMRFAMQKERENARRELGELRREIVELRRRIEDS